MTCIYIKQKPQSFRSNATLVVGVLGVRLPEFVSKFHVLLAKQTWTRNIYSFSSLSIPPGTLF